MVAKKKTVSELNIIVESLKETVEDLALKVKKIDELEKQIEYLEDELKGYKSYADKEKEMFKSKKVQEKLSAGNVRVSLKQRRCC